MRYEKELDTVLSEIIARWGIPGLGVGMVEAGRIIYTRYFGVQSLDTGAPVSADTIWGVASISKCFVATAVMQLVEAGQVELDTPLICYLPEFRLDDPRSSQITLRQMLSHTSGMPDMNEDEYDELVTHPEYDEGAAERYLRGLAQRKMVSAPGERFLYSNIAYNVLGCLIARLTGRSFETAMKERILQPAGMASSTFFFPEVAPEHLAIPHLRTPLMQVSPVYPYHRADAPASFLHATLEDMCRWCIACLNDSSSDGQRLLTRPGFELMWTPAANWGFPPFYESIGLGWTLGHYDGVKTVSHGGMGFGWSDFLTLLPEKNRAVVLLCNEESSARSRTLRALVHAALDLEPVVNTVSWMIPISRALAQNGYEAALACVDELKDGGSEDYFVDEDELISLAYQMTFAGKPELAEQVLKLNIHAFPSYGESYLVLGRIQLRQGRLAEAEFCALKALELDQESKPAVELLEKSRQK